MSTRQDDETWVTAQFLDLYGRAPSAYELGHVVDALQNGTYTRSRWSAEAEGQETDAAVQRIFRVVVGAERAADDPGIQFYSQRLKNGTMTRAQVRAEISAKTAENHKLQGTSGTVQDQTAGKEDAAAYVNDVLHSYGLDGLSDWVWSEIESGHSTTRIFQDLRQRPEYKQRFAGLEQRQAAGFNAMNEMEYLHYEQDARQAMRAAGLPADFYDSPQDFANFIGKDVSIGELQSRINDGFLAATSAPQEVKDQLAALYGVNTNQLAAYFLDPDKALPLIQRQFQAAQTSGAAVRTGYGALAASEAERLVSLGVSAQEAEQGFGYLQNAQELMGSLPGENGARISREEQQAAVFGGDAAATAKIKKQGETRVSEGSGNASFQLGNSGAAGLSRRG